jgi:hypothetical protein
VLQAVVEADIGRRTMAAVVNVKSGAFYHIYIGRANARYGLLASPFANPFTIGRDGTRADVLHKYKEHILSSPDLLVLLPALKGKILGCWCKPAPCHGDVLVELIETLGAKTERR